jgi:hypothetical protein
MPLQCECVFRSKLNNVSTARRLSALVRASPPCRARGLRRRRWQLQLTSDGSVNTNTPLSYQNSALRQEKEGQTTDRLTSHVVAHWAAYAKSDGEILVSRY